MIAKQLKRYREELEALAAVLERNLLQDRREFLHAEDANDSGEHLPPPESDFDSGIQEVEIGVIANEAGMLEDVRSALARIEHGTFGTCQSCHTAIAQARLDAAPYVRNCIKCARAEVTARR